MGHNVATESDITKTVALHTVFLCSFTVFASCKTSLHKFIFGYSKVGEWEQGRQYGQQEEKEESAYFTFPGYPHKNWKHLSQGPGAIRQFVLKNGVCCRFVMFHDTSYQSAVFMLECVQSFHCSIL